MNFISLSNVFFSYDSTTDLFANLSLTVTDSERVAIIGDNGCGKTTLLKILSGDIVVNSGNVARNATIYYMKQLYEPDSKSGGERQRFELARAFDSGAAILLLDEPTNNLDIDARRDFFARMDAYPFGVVIVSHDRELLGRVDKIIEITNGQLRTYGGNYDFYVRQKNLEMANLQSKYTDSEKALCRLNKTINIAQNTRQHHEAKQRKDIATGKRSPIAANALKGKSQETEAKKRAIIQKKIDEQLTLQQSLTDQMHDDKIKIPVPNKPFYSKELITISGLHFAYGDKVIFDNFDFTMYGGTRIRLCGKNGAGKTTLLKIICGELKPDSGTVKTFGKIAYLNQDLSLLNRDKTIIENIMDISECLKHDAHVIAANFGFRGNTSSKLVSMLSGGELLKATSATVLGGDNQPDLLILDEPTNNLEIKSIAILEDALNQYRGAILLVSHDEIFAKNIKVDKMVMI